MLYIFGAILLIVFLVPMIVTKIKTNDNFHPIVILSLLNILTIVPYIFLIAVDETFFTEKVIAHKSFQTLEMSFFKFTMLQLLAYISMIMGLSIKKEFKLFRNIPVINNELSDQKIKFFIRSTKTL